LRNLAYFGVPRGPNRFLNLRRESFTQLVGQDGDPCETFEVSGTEQESSPNWERELDRMVKWLQRLPKPVGIMACDDHRGFQLLDACRREGIPVPEEVAVVGINNDRVLCELAYPPLSSVDPGGIRIGYEAAACLDRMMRGGRPPRKPIHLEPSGLVARQSSDVIAVEDREVAAALRFIRENAGSPITVEDVVRAVMISRSFLERKFQQHLGRTPKAEILRVRMAQAEQLLAESDLPLAEIALRCGFNHENNFSATFLRETGYRPGAYRKRCRLGRETAHG
jgi:LacI family transcriptional regulator